MHIPDSFKLRILHSSLNELGLNSVADQLIEQVNQKGLLSETAHERLVSSSKKAKLLEWIDNELIKGNYLEVVDYLQANVDQYGEFDDNELIANHKDSEPVEGHPPLLDILNLEEDPKITKKFFVSVVLIMVYLIKRTAFLDELLKFLMIHEDNTTNNSLIQYLSDELSPILDSIDVSGDKGSLFTRFFSESIVTHLTREEESSKLLSLVLQSPLDDAKIESLLFNKKILFQSVHLKSNSPHYLINNLRQLLVKNYFGSLFLPDFYEGALPYLNYQLPTDFLSRVIENSLLYTRLQAPYYLPTRYIQQKSRSRSNSKHDVEQDEKGGGVAVDTEEFIPPLESCHDSYYKPRFPMKMLKSLSTHTGQVWFTKFSPLGKYLTAGDSEGQVIIYDVLNDFAPIATLISNSNADKNAWVNSTYKPTTASKAITYCCWDQSEEYLVSGSLGARVRVWYIGGLKYRLQNLSRSGVSTRSSKNKFADPNESSISGGNEVKLMACFTLGEGIRIHSCDFVPIDNSQTPQFIIGSPDKLLKAFDIYGTELYDFYGNTLGTALENSGDEDVKMKDEDSESINYGGGGDDDGDGDDDDNALERSHMLRSKESNVNLSLSFNRHDNPKPDNFNRINDLAITPNGKVLITVDDDSQVDFYIIPNLTSIESVTQKIASITFNERLTSCSVSRSGKYLLLSLVPDELQVWDIENLLEVGKPILFRKYVGHNQSTYIVRSSFGYLDINNNQEELVLSGSVDGDIYIWNLFTGRLITRVKGHEGVCNFVDWNTSFVTPTNYNKDYGKLWCSVGDDKLVKIWGPPNFYNDN